MKLAAYRGGRAGFTAMLVLFILNALSGAFDAIIQLWLYSATLGVMVGGVVFFFNLVDQEEKQRAKDDLTV